MLGDRKIVTYHYLSGSARNRDRCVSGHCRGSPVRETLHFGHDPRVHHAREPALRTTESHEFRPFECLL